MNETIDSVLTFWFGECRTSLEINNDRKSLWWSKDENIDQKIAARFSPLVVMVANGDLDHWRESAAGMLASIICTDQFPRNIYRGQEKSFAYDPVALALAQQAIATGVDQELPPIRRVFMYLPLEHSENLSDQQQCLALFTGLAETAPDDEKELFDSFLDFARRHLEIIERFGRFPHRNKILGRTDSAEELEFLEKPGSTF